jgi:ATP-dependent Lhr-like helicase
MENSNVFDLFGNELKEIVKKRFSIPTPIQQLVIPKVLEGKNMLVISETGSGKTEACLLPIFDLWIRQQEPKPTSILYITPLRSLNRDLLKRILWWANELGFDVSVRHGDTTQYERYMQAQNPCDLLISTPETLQAILTGKIMSAHLSNIKWILVDEIHELVDNKRGVQLSVGLERLKELIKLAGNNPPQIIGLSATIGSPKQVARFLTGCYNNKLEIINTAKISKFNIKVESPEPGKEDIEVSPDLFVGPKTVARLRRIDQLIRKNNSVLMFTNTREFAEILSSRLKILDKDLPLETHHSSLSKEIRTDAEERFKAKKLKSLVCTSSLELGLDIGSINLVLQYQSPRQVTKLLQRIGRSGHSLTEVSKGVIISSDSDDCFESAIITKHALKGLIEPTLIYFKALDVLGHQIVGLTLEKYKTPIDEAYKIIKTAFPYKDLTKHEFLEVCRLMQKLGFIWIDDKFSTKPILKRRKKAWQYYYQNLSTIPDVKKYQIFNMASNQFVGTLDAEFIALHGDTGTSFICKGQAWKILEINKDRVIVEPQMGIEAAIPSWEGELIPVPFEVAKKVGELRHTIKEKINKNVINYLVSNYPITHDIANIMFKKIKKQLKHGLVPTHKDILIEYWEDYVIIHSCFGSMVNETLGRVLSILLSSKMGSVGLQTDPYRIILKLPTPNWKTVSDIFNELKPDMIKTVLELALPNTELFKWRFLHIAKRFGIIDKDVEYGKGYLEKIIDSYIHSPPWKETFQEIFQEKLDIEKTIHVLEMIKKGEIKIHIKPGLSPLGKDGLSKRYEIVASIKPEKEIFMAFKKRLFNTKIRLICCQCGWAINYLIKDLPKDIICLKCHAKLIGVIKPWETEKEKLITKFLKKIPLTKDELKMVDTIMDTASLVISSGKNAVKVLAGRGIGPTTASRILAKTKKGDELLNDILDAEKLYIKTKRFWKE